MSNAMPAARTLVAVTLTPANIRSAYPEFGDRKVEVQYVEVAVTRKRSNGSMVTDSNGDVLGAVFSWGDGSTDPWAYVTARDPHMMPDDMSHATDAQHRYWAEVCAADVQVLADAAVEDITRKAEGSPETRRVLTRANMCTGRTRHECLARAGLAVI